MNRLKQLRKQHGYSQEKLAAELGMSLSMYAKVEQGAVEPSRAFMVKIKARFPESSIDHIFFDNNSNIIAVAERSLVV